MSNVKVGDNPIYFCYSFNQKEYLVDNGLDVIGVGNNANTGKRFWQFLRGDKLDELLTKWTANRPKR